MSKQPTEDFQQGPQPEEDPLYTDYFSGPKNVHREVASNNVDKDNYDNIPKYMEYRYEKIMDNNVKHAASSAPEDETRSSLQIKGWSDAKLLTAIFLAAGIGLAAPILLTHGSFRNLSQPSEALIIRR